MKNKYYFINIKISICSVRRLWSVCTYHWYLLRQGHLKSESALCVVMDYFILLTSLNLSMINTTHHMRQNS